MKIERILKAGAIGAALLISAGSAQAGVLSTFSSGGWTLFSGMTPNEDGTVSPGAGGQAFDAEYLFYRQSGSTFEIGIQTGFDIISGNPTVHGGVNYWTGDIALNFGGPAVGDDYGYAIDFGQMTKDYHNNYSSGNVNQRTVDADTYGDDGTGDGVDALGFYSGVQWGGRVVGGDTAPGGHTVSLPFAMSGGALVADAIFADTSGSGTTSGGYGGTSYFRTFSIDLTKTGLDLSSDLDIYAHWTMSCGNDEMNGYATIASVPEPNTIAMIMLGLMSIGFASVRRRSIAIA